MVNNLTSQIFILKLSLIFIFAFIVNTQSFPNALRCPVNPFKTYPLKDLPSHNIPGLEGVSSNFLHWFVGFTDAEGCFRIEFRNIRSITFNFEINLHMDDRAALDHIIKTLKVGRVTVSGGLARLKICSYADIKTVIIPIFSSIP